MNPNGVPSVEFSEGHNPFGVDISCGLCPKVGRCAANPGLWDETPSGKFLRHKTDSHRHTERNDARFEVHSTTQLHAR